MEIVTLPPEDWQAYRDLRLRALKEDPQAFSSSYADAAQFDEEKWKGRLRDAFQGQRSWLFFARHEGKLVGMIGAFVDEASSETATIVSVYVPAEERGKGISSQLMKCILSALSKSSSFKAVSLTVNSTQLSAIGLYRKFGFQPIGTVSAVTGDGKPAEEVTMERPLPYDPYQAA